jgi:hypothetical protein
VVVIELQEGVAVVLLALVFGISGVLLGTFANARALAVVAGLTAPGTFLAGFDSSETLLVGFLWSLTGLVAAQLGYMATVFVRATWFAETREAPQSALSR